MKDLPTDKVGLIDLDGTVADYDRALRAKMAEIQAPNEPPYQDRFAGGEEPPYVEARRKLIQGQTGFWRNLQKIPLGFEVVEEMRELGFALHVLTKGPSTTPNAWSEKLEWCREHLPDATVTITGDKSLVYGRVLVDDFPPYFTKWLRVRERGLVVCVAHPWNADYAPGGSLFHPNVFRYDGSNRKELKDRLLHAYAREARKTFSSLMGKST